MKYLIGLGILLVIGFPLILGSVTIVPPGHCGVKVVLGSVDSDYLPEGMNFVIPFVTKINEVSLRQETQMGKTECFSSDLQTMTIVYNTLYRIPNHQAVSLFQKYQGNPYDTMINPRLNEALKEVTSKYKAEEAVKNREAIKAKVIDKIRLSMGNLVVVEDIVINNIDLTDELERAIEFKQVEEQKALAKTYELQKERTEAEITIVKAEAEAKSVKIKGEAIKAAPEVIQLEMVKKWNGISPLVVGEGNGIMLPLNN